MRVESLWHLEKLENIPTQRQGAQIRCVWNYHLIVEFWKCPFENLAEVKIVEEGLKYAINGSNEIRIFSYQFEPFGVSAQISDGVTHIYIHTWPENGYSAIDIIAKTKEDSYRVLQRLQEAFLPQYVCAVEVPRGIMEEWGET
ncbi:MAG: S-adenosylmethionine decarboxylase [Thermodesulfobacteriaceae bacterium]|nr:S-adenosylmethionine decarboxylase [Caldimicrobium sp.]MCX8041563.1 S-adenosylmethionine decarboxylase [Thermodesulfobacteriaceae bacterium]MDW8136096.1 S-adenosylmethionine decarboxylase [Thermodesulfobacterium sp.]